MGLTGGARVAKRTPEKVPGMGFTGLHRAPVNKMVADLKNYVALGLVGPLL